MTLRFVAISGSLRSASMNGALLRAAAALAPPGVSITIYDEVGVLPHFNPDQETPLPAAVGRLHDLLRACDGVLIACPEYAHGVPGSFKNALDWVVGAVGIEPMPVALINTSAHAGHAQMALAEIVTTMGWAVLEAASVRIPVARKGVEPDAIGQTPEFAEPLRAALLALMHAAHRHIAGHRLAT